MRRILARLSTDRGMNETRIETTRSDFGLLSMDFTSRTSRIPFLNTSGTTEDIGQVSFEQNPALDAWSKLLLSAFIDEAYCRVAHLLAKAPTNHAWSDMYSEYFSHTTTMKIVADVPQCYAEVSVSWDKVRRNGIER